MTRLTLPRIYQPPLGLPFNWRNELTGVLQEAVAAYYAAHVEREAPALSAEQLEILIAWAEYYIHAPCWKESEGELARLRESIQRVTTLGQLDSWIEQCQDYALDPF